jgi:hypothetical protein
MDEKYNSVDIEAAGPIPPTYSMLSLGACVVGDEQTTFYTELTSTLFPSSTTGAKPQSLSHMSCATTASWVPPISLEFLKGSSRDFHRGRCEGCEFSLIGGLTSSNRLLRRYA